MRSASKQPAMTTSPKPHSPPPEMLPSSTWVKPNSLAQSTRIAPRTPKPTPSAKMAKIAADSDAILALFAFFPVSCRFTRLVRARIPRPGI